MAAGTIKTMLIYAISYYDGLVKFYYPEAFIAEIRNGAPAYILKKAVPETLRSYGLDTDAADQQRLISLCEQCSLHALEARYQKKGRKRHRPLEDLLSDAEIAKTLVRFLDHKLGALITEAAGSLPLYIGVKRKEYLPALKHEIVEAKAIPHLRFVKSEDGIHYTLRMLIGSEELNLRSAKTVIITDKTGWFIHDQRVIQMEHINGNKLRPFLRSTEIHIPPRFTKTYFEKFVMSMVGKVNVDVEGFEVIENKSVSSKELRLVQDFITGEYLLDLVFSYGSSSFSMADPATKRVHLAIDKEGDIVVTLNKRDQAAEKQLAEAAEVEAQVKLNSAYRLQYYDTADKYGIITWLTRNYDNLLNQGWIINELWVDNKKITTDLQFLDFHYDSNIDWFDLHAVIRIGEVEVSFKRLIAHIKNDERLCMVADDLWFVIPEEWMEKFSLIAKHGIIREDRFVLGKAHFALLEDETNAMTGVEGILNEEDFDFVVPETLKATLRPYQLEGAKWLAMHYENGLGACLADDMGLGKTLQTITVLLLAKSQIKEESRVTSRQMSLFDAPAPHFTALRALVIAPASLVQNWTQELRKFAPTMHTYQHVGAKRSRNRVTFDSYDVIISTYQTVMRDTELLSQIDFEYIILDESQYIKNRSSKIFQSLRKLNTRHRITLSGTPIENSLSDLWSQMEFINPAILGKYSDFKVNYVTPIEKNQDEGATEELKLLLSPFILRRTKSEVLDDLPDLMEQIIYCTMKPQQESLYEKEKSKVRNFLLGADFHEKQHKIHVFAALLRLRQLANHPALLDEYADHDSGKFDVVTNTILSLTKAGNKLLVFSSFKSHLALYAKYLKDSAIQFAELNGSHSASQRTSAIDRFSNNDSCQVFLISIKAGGVGLNLTAANYILILDPWWNPFAEKQAIARAHRIGQKSSVHVLRFISSNSIEEKIQQLQIKKLHVADQFIEVEGGVPDLDKDVVLGLL